ncbi:MAG: hypothetical protein AABX93_01930 [Nanoarchaeota archaeon]
MGRGLRLVLFISVLFLSVQFISADVSVSPTSDTANLNEIKSFSVIVSNTYTDGTFQNNGTVTQIVFTLPSGLLFVSGTDSSSPSSTFSSSSNTLTWTNTTYVVNLSSQSTFSFSANATSLGTSSINVNSTLANGSIITKSISLTVSDSSPPTVNLVSPENNADDTDGVLVFRCNATDNIAVSSIKLSITSNGSEIYSNIANFSAAGAQRQAEWDYAFSNIGTYKWNCFANDSGSSSVWGSNRTLTISAISASCSPNWDCDESDWSVCANDIQTRICNDLNSCGNNATKPDESQACTDSLSCTSSDWECVGGWNPNECPQNGTQTRTCTKTSACEGESGKPDASRTCTPSGGNAWIFITIILVLIFGGGAAAAFFYFRNRNSMEAVPQDNSGNQQQQDYGYSYQ